MSQFDEVLQGETLGGTPVTALDLYIALTKSSL